MLKKIVIILALLLYSCAGSNLYVKDSKPKLHVYGKGQVKSFQTVYFKVSNPTSERLHKKVVCRLNNSDFKQSVRIIIHPRSDKKGFINLSVAGKYKCYLEDDFKPGSQGVVF